MQNYESKKNKTKILLHTCCATCLGYPYDFLSENYDVTVFYFNPNIYPDDEYKKRFADVKKFAQEFNISLLTSSYNYDSWETYISGLEKEPEGGKRCEKCFRFRLEETAAMAKKMKFDYFASTMSISPHKNFEIINNIGKDLEKFCKIPYLESNFKKKDGFKKTIEISKKHAFYRQNYCGCKYSIK